MSVIPVFMIFCGMWVNSVTDLTSWRALILGIFIYTGVYSAGMYCIAMNDYEKDVIRKPLNKLLVKIRIRRV